MYSVGIGAPQGWKKIHSYPQNSIMVTHGVLFKICDKDSHTVSGRFDTNRSCFDAHVKSFRYTSKVVSIPTEVSWIQTWSRSKRKLKEVFDESVLIFAHIRRDRQNCITQFPEGKQQKTLLKYRHCVCHDFYRCGGS